MSTVYQKKFMDGNNRSRFIALFISGVCGSLTNTLLVMNLIYIVFKNEYAFAKNMDPQAVYTFYTLSHALHGIPEAIVAGLAAAGVVRAISAYRSKNSLHTNTGSN